MYYTSERHGNCRIYPNKKENVEKSKFFNSYTHISKSICIYIYIHMYI